MKKLIDAVDDVVLDTLRGMAAAHPSLRVDLDQRIIVRTDAPRTGKVGLVSGGGSGHEPLHGGFVGYGMLDAACPGEVFTSPVPDQILAATTAVSGGAGVVHLVKNYTGDVLNFQMAAELADDEDIEVIPVVIDDDVAEADGSVADVAAVAREVNERSRSFGVALTACTVPAAGQPTFELGPDEIELGIGIHGEPGRERTKLRTATEIVDFSLSAINDDMPVSGSDLLVMVNGMGGTPLMELYGAYAAAEKWLTGHGATVSRRLVGNYVTSLDMAGCMISVCRLTPRLAELWDAPVETAGLRWGR
jgi:phosphoenolpyruvate---glycerone phosphotransferase subunit DhaK